MAPVSAHSGYWGVPTATMDWCEQNYEVSILVVTEGGQSVKHSYIWFGKVGTKLFTKYHHHPRSQSTRMCLVSYMNPQVTWYVAEFWNTISNLAMIGTSISNSTCKKTKILIKFTKEFETHKPIHSACVQWDPEGEEGELREKASMMQKS